jgi:hypothetical protein
MRERESSAGVVRVPRSTARAISSELASCRAGTALVIVVLVISLVVVLRNASLRLQVNFDGLAHNLI